VIGQSIPGEYVEVDYEIVRERWNDYQFPHGIHVRARPILMKLFWPPGDHPLGVDTPLGVTTSNIVIVTAPLDQTGDPSPAMSQRELDMIPRQLLRVLENREYWNYYRLKANRGFIKIKANLTKAERLVGLFDATRAPMVSIGTMVVASQASADEVEAEIAQLRETG
jgi:hypothetical protein